MVFHHEDPKTIILFYHSESYNNHLKESQTLKDIMDVT